MYHGVLLLIVFYGAFWAVYVAEYAAGAFLRIPDWLIRAPISSFVFGARHPACTAKGNFFPAFWLWDHSAFASL
jgi:hypothetical protein